MSETTLQRDIIDTLAKVGVEAVRVQSGATKVRRGWAHFAREGTPDLLLAMFRTSWLEVKTSTGRLSAAQEKRHGELVRAGCRVAVVRSVQDALAVVARWRDEDRRLEAMLRDAEALRRAGLEP